MAQEGGFAAYGPTWAHIARDIRWTGKQIAAESGVSPATVSRVLRRVGLNKLSALERAEPIRRYERENPSELIRYQEARPYWLRRAPHHRTATRRRQSPPRQWLGVRSYLHRRCLVARQGRRLGNPGKALYCRLIQRDQCCSARRKSARPSTIAPLNAQRKRR
jgi:hypothetical protein